VPNYRFKAHDIRTGSEKLGAAVLADDDEALAFAKRVIRELIHSDAKLYTTWTMEVAGKRTVASVPFESATGGQWLSDGVPAIEVLLHR
jgi:hypothetical protein